MKVETYRERLMERTDWTLILLAESGLPGPRGNLELAAAAARLDPLRLEPYLALTPDDAPENTPRVFLVFCGVLGLGVRLAWGDPAALARLRTFAGDPRWRVREAVATGLQLWGDADLPALLAAMRGWAGGGWLEQRAAVAALCEPRLLKQPETVANVLSILDAITTSFERAAERSDSGFEALRKTLGYGWSVAVAAAPAIGKPSFEHWLATTDRDVRWVLRENLKKNRLLRLDPTWVSVCLERLA